MLDLTGVIIAELKADPAVAGITTRIRGAQPAVGDTPPMVILVRAGRERVLPGGRGGARMKMQDARWYARCYGADPKQAAQLSGAVSDAIHARGPRTDTQGRLIHWSLDGGGAGADTDPDTKWALEVLVVRAFGVTEAVA